MEQHDHVLSTTYPKESAPRDVLRLFKCHSEDRRGTTTHRPTRQQQPQRELDPQRRARGWPCPESRTMLRCQARDSLCFHRDRSRQTTTQTRQTPRNVMSVGATKRTPPSSMAVKRGKGSRGECKEEMRRKRVFSLTVVDGRQRRFYVFSCSCISLSLFCFLPATLSHLPRPFPSPFLSTPRCRMAVESVLASPAQGFFARGHRT